MSKILKRLSEPSSAAGLATAITVGSAWGGGSMPMEYALPAFILALLGVFFPEAMNRQPPQ